MWPGSDLPVGPPPHKGPPYQGSPPKISPSGAWYVLPAALIVAAVLLFVVVLVVLWEELDAADGPRASGDVRSGAEIQLTAGHDYFIYVRTDDPAPRACTLAPEGGNAEKVSLAGYESWTVAPPAGYRLGAVFKAPRDGPAELTCDGVTGPTIVGPDDTVFGELGLGMMISLVLGGTGAVVFVVILVMRASSTRRRRAAMNPYRGY